MLARPPIASLGESIDAFRDAADSFFSNLAAVQWGLMAFALLCFGIYLALRSRAYFNVLRAAYPETDFQWRQIWAAYMAAYGFNNVIPARGGDVIKLFLVRSSIPGSTYPTIASSFAVEMVFDAMIGSLILAFAFSQGVFPKPPDFARLDAFDLAFLAQHPRFTLFLITALAIAALAGVALLAAHVRAFWERVRQGLAILSDRERYLREVFAVQLAGWLFRFGAFWFLLEAFNVGGSVRNVLLVLGVNAVAAAVPFTPGGAGVQQALLVVVFAGAAATGTLAAYSVGQQVAIAVFSLSVGFIALLTVFRVRSFKEVLARGRAERAAQ